MAGLKSDLYESSRLGSRISILYRQGASFLTEALKEHDLGAGQHACLLVISETDGHRQEDLARILSVDKAHIARAVKKLIALGYMVRRQHPLDQRSRTLHLTEEGRTIIPEIHQAIKNWNNHILAGFTESQKLMLMELLQKAAENAMSRGRTE